MNIIPMNISVQYFCLLLLSTLRSLTSSQTESNSQLLNFIAGGVAGSISSTLTTPFEVVKTQLQSSRVSGRYARNALFSFVLFLKYFFTLYLSG